MPPIDLNEALEEEITVFFDLYLEREEARRAAFRQDVAQSGGPTESELDGSPESLVPLWAWMVDRIDKGQAEPPIGPLPFLPKGPPLPLWYLPDPPEEAPKRLRAPVLWDVDGLAYEVAWIIRTQAPEFEWVIARWPRHLAYEYQNHPVLKGHGIEIDPRTTCYKLAVRLQIMRAGREPERLLETFREWQRVWTPRKARYWEIKAPDPEKEAGYSVYR
jgi:hypothetical protein